MAKHRIDRVYCCPEKVRNEFIERWKSKNWNEKEDSDDIAFWDQQQEEYLEHLPNHVGMFDFEDEAVEEDTMALWGKEGTI